MKFKLEDYAVMFIIASILFILLFFPVKAAFFTKYPEYEEQNLGRVIEIRIAKSGIADSVLIVSTDKDYCFTINGSVPIPKNAEIIGKFTRSFAYNGWSIKWKNSQKEYKVYEGLPFLE